MSGTNYWTTQPPVDPANVAITGGNSWFVPSGGASGVAVSGAADTNENTLATITLPALSANAQVRVTTAWTVTSNANAKTARVRFSGGAGTIVWAGSLASTTFIQHQLIIANRGATNSQVCTAPGTGQAYTVGTAAVTSAVDTSVAGTTIVITAQKGVNTDTMTLESYLVEIYKP